MDAVSSGRIGDLDVAFRRRGEGPPLVLLHDGICDDRVWRDHVGVHPPNERLDLLSRRERAIGAVTSHAHDGRLRRAGSAP